MLLQKTVQFFRPAVYVRLLYVKCSIVFRTVVKNGLYELVLYIVNLIDYMKYRGKQ